MPLFAGHIPGRVLLGFAASETKTTALPLAEAIKIINQPVYEWRKFNPGWISKSWLNSNLDAAKNRGCYAWLSVKVPGNNWAAVASGSYDSDLDLVKEVANARSDKWAFAIHHEPDGDGDLSVWASMQKHVSDYLADINDKVAYSCIGNGHWFGPMKPDRYNAAFPTNLITTFNANKGIVAVDSYNSPVWPTSKKMQSYIDWSREKGTNAIGFGEFGCVPGDDMAKCWNVLSKSVDIVGLANYFNSGENSISNYLLVPANWKPTNPDYVVGANDAAVYGDAASAQKLASFKAALTASAKVDPDQIVDPGPLPDSPDPVVIVSGSGTGTGTTGGNTGTGTGGTWTPGSGSVSSIPGITVIQPGSDPMNINSSVWVADGTVSLSNGHDLPSSYYTFGYVSGNRVYWNGPSTEVDIPGFNFQQIWSAVVTYDSSTQKEGMNWDYWPATEELPVPGRVVLSGHKQYEIPASLYLSEASHAGASGPSTFWLAAAADGGSPVDIVFRCFDKTSGNLIASLDDSLSYHWIGEICVISDTEALFIWDRANGTEPFVELEWDLLTVSGSVITRTSLFTYDPPNRYDQAYSHAFNPVTGYGISVWDTLPLGAGKEAFTWKFESGDVTAVSTVDWASLTQTAIGDGLSWRCDEYSYGNMTCLSDGTFVDLAYQYDSDVVQQHAVIRFSVGASGPQIIEWKYLPWDAYGDEVVQVPYNYEIGWGSATVQKPAIGFDDSSGTLTMLSDYGVVYGGGGGIVAIRDLFGSQIVSRTDANILLPVDGYDNDAWLDVWAGFNVQLYNDWYIAWGHGIYYLEDVVNFNWILPGFTGEGGWYFSTIFKVVDVLVEQPGTGGGQFDTSRRVYARSPTSYTP